MGEVKTLKGIPLKPLIELICRREKPGMLIKLAAILLSVAAITGLQWITIVYPMMVEAESNKLVYEHSIIQKIEDLENHTCDLKNSFYKECELAKTQIPFTTELMWIFITIMITFYVFGLIMLIFYFVCWLCYPHMKNG